MTDVLKAGPEGYATSVERGEVASAETDAPWRIGGQRKDQDMPRTLRGVYAVTRIPESPEQERCGFSSVMGRVSKPASACRIQC